MNTRFDIRDLVDLLTNVGYEERYGKNSHAVFTRHFISFSGGTPIEIRIADLAVRRDGFNLPWTPIRKFLIQAFGEYQAELILSGKPQEIVNKDRLTCSDLAVVLGVKTQTVYRAIREKRLIPDYKTPAGHYIFMKEAVMNLLTINNFN